MLVNVTSHLVITVAASIKIIFFGAETWKTTVGNSGRHGTAPASDKYPETLSRTAVHFRCLSNNSGNIYDLLHLCGSRHLPGPWFGDPSKLPTNSAARGKRVLHMEGHLVEVHRPHGRVGETYCPGMYTPVASGDPN